MNLLPPVEGHTFPNLEDLILSTNQHAFAEGYAITTKRTKKNKTGDVRKAWLRCDRGSTYKPKGYDKRQSSTRQIECPFSLIAVRDADLETWSFNIIDGHHNHEPTLGGSHAVHRKNAMTKDVKDTVVAQTRINISTKQILSGLRLDGDEENPIVKPSDIYNIRARHRQEELGPYSAVQALMLALSKEEDWYMRHTVDAHGRVTKLFFAKTSAQRILKRNHEVLLMDCTYKTNTYRMPLCIINGVTALNTTFYIGFAFLSHEMLEDYLWVLESYSGLIESLDIPDPTVFVTDSEPGLISAIPRTFPRAKHLLCLWHLNKNVLTNCRPWYGDDEDEWKEFYNTWNTVLYSKTEQKFDDAWNAMRLRYQADFVPIDYLDDLIRLHKTKIITCFTSKVLHFGNTSTSRTESSHAKLKLELKSSTGMNIVFPDVNILTIF